LFFRFGLADELAEVGGTKLELEGGVVIEAGCGDEALGVGGWGGLRLERGDCH
jgi:hypothetical protein